MCGVVFSTVVQVTLKSPLTASSIINTGAGGTRLHGYNNVRAALSVLQTD